MLCVVVVFEYHTNLVGYEFWMTARLPLTSGDRAAWSAAWIDESTDSYFSFVPISSNALSLQDCQS